MVARGHAIYDPSIWRGLDDQTGEDAAQMSLSHREFQVLKLLSAGLGNREIAEELHISTETVKTHTERLYKRLDATTRTDAVAKALRAGIID
jgi:DNA-binding NarL/FixJ family response regulator